MKIPPIDYAEEITLKAEAFAKWLTGLSGDSYLREALMKIAIREFIWAIYDEFERERGALSEHLEHFPEIVRDELSRDKKG